MNKKNKEQTELSYYGLYLLKNLQDNKFEQASDRAFIKGRADHAAEVYEQARRDGHSPDGAQELAMSALVRGLHHSKHSILLEVVENEFAGEVPEDRREAFVERLLPLVDNVFSIYDLADDLFPLSPGYENLYLELTGATALYLEAYGIQ